MTDDDRRLLEFEERYPRRSGAKEAAARAEFGYSMARYYQRLLELVREQDVVAEFPMVANRVTRASRAAASRRAARQL